MTRLSRRALEIIHTQNDCAGLELIQRADEKLYEAKNSGRNRVCG